MQMEETDTDDSNSFVTSVKAKAKRVLLKAKVIGFLSLILFAVCMLHVPWPWGGHNKRFVRACHAYGLIKNNRLQRN
ncbi:putative magnesium transporter NIPA8 [Zea mays]|uniref:Putative magnesium transporter NIPA8 n=1 Tax=Zea mays TaxID=4577 RepID=A0A1D6Q2F9_MAIZE|nr:putative magnesium transporter NIPA8 [Zea mays]